MGRFEHGGDVYAHPGVLDFSASVSPLGMPAAAREALVRQVDSLEKYPDPRCRDLRAAIARHEGVPESSVVCTAGATDLMDRVCRARRPRVGLVARPCYSGYEQALLASGARVAGVALLEEEGFAVTDRFADAIRTGLNLAFVASPNNPTGLPVQRDLMLRILARARQAGCVLVVDECFADLAGVGSAVELAQDWPNLLVMKAFTKTYAMAGLRLGYGICSDQGLVGALERAGQPWAVSVPAQVAGVAALSDGDYLPRAQAYVARERARLAAGLAGAGMRVVPGQANYLLFKSPRDLYAPLLQRGILIRWCQNFAGLGERWYRVAVRTQQDNDALLRALGEVA